MTTNRICQLGASASILLAFAALGWPAADAAPEVSAREAIPAPKQLPRFGIMTDVGLPDGANASFVFRPFRPLRLHAGGGHNGISPGVRGGLTFVPFSTWITPTLSVDYGHYFEGNANPLARMVSGDSTFSSAILERVGYDYANAHVGLQLGQKWGSFYLQAGVSRMTGSIRNLATVTDGMSAVRFSDDPKVEMWSVSARLGFVFFVLK